MRASGYERVAHDYYVEPGWVVDQLLQVETFEGMSWDPSCGSGTIPRRMQAAGLEANGSDIVDRGWIEGLSLVDFMTDPNPVPPGVRNIVSNPPYGIIQAYVERALTLVPGKVAVITRLAFLEGQKRGATFWDVHPASRVWVCSKRPSMPPGDKVQVKSSSRGGGGSIAYAWFVWDKAYTGPTILSRLR